VPERPGDLIEMAAVQPLTAAQTAKVRAFAFGLLRT
jgi:hypothetical protein